MQACSQDCLKGGLHRCQSDVLVYICKMQDQGGCGGMRPKKSEIAILRSK